MAEQKRTVFDEFAERIGGINIDKLASPDSEQEDGERLLGTMTPEIKRIWGARELVARDVRRAKLKLEMLVGEGQDCVSDGLLTIEQMGRNHDIRAAEAEFLIATKQNQALDALLWAEIYRAFDARLLGESVGVRKDWSVVAIPDRGTEVDGEMIKKIMAGIVQKLR